MAASFAVGFVPGAGELMDADVLADPNASEFTRGVAGASLYANALTAGLLPNLGPIARQADELPEVAEGMTRLWRAVEPEELADVQRLGDYNIHPNSTFKRFAFDELSLDDFARANPDRSYTKTFIDIPTNRLDEMYEHADPGGVGRAVGIDVYEHPEFYEWFEQVNIVVE